LNIAVCLKQVPSTETRVKIAPDAKHIDPAGVTFVVNPYDEYALEEALQLKEANGGEVTVVSVGGAAVVSAIRSALAMGADKAVLLKTDAEFDNLAAAKLLAAELAEKGFDLILLGKQAVDDDASQVGPMLAELLKLPCASVVVDLEVNGDRARASREIEGGTEVSEFSLPAVVTAQKGLNEPRYASLKGIMAAKKKPIEEKPITPQPAVVEVLGLELPAPKEPGRIIGEGATAVDELIRVLREEAKIL
jgi:electron transfer flavoprotein beta subunit